MAAIPIHVAVSDSVAKPLLTLPPNPTPILLSVPAVVAKALKKSNPVAIKSNVIKAVVKI